MHRPDEPPSPNTEPAEGAPLLPLGNWMWRQARKLIVFVIGMTVLLIGIAMMVLPGPAFIVIPVGLAILASEFIWARRLLQYAKRRLQELTQRSPNPPSEPSEGEERTQQQIAEQGKSGLDSKKPAADTPAVQKEP